MGNNIAIEFEHVSKQYRLGLVSTKTLSHDIRRFWITHVLGKEDPYLKIGETNDRASKGNSDYVWALRNIDFKVEQGDVVGIIGKNGAGKSTLLKLLSRVTGPTTGTIRAHGRIGSLLEVGTGFHGEMTGRENIFMNGAILGMTRNEIQAKLDEIIDFSGCERYTDPPVKRYSSGMTVRLGFAVAAFLEPEILVVDEVLAVGDAEFQKKAIGKMKDVSQGQGRTVLFVSHNMESIRNLCKTGVILEKGQMKFRGTADEAVDLYLSREDNQEFQLETETLPSHRACYYSKEVEITHVKLLHKTGSLSFGEDINLEVNLKCNRPGLEECNIITMICDMSDRKVCSFVSPMIKLSPNQKEYTATISLKNHNLAKGRYYMTIHTGVDNPATGIYGIEFDEVTKVLSFEIMYSDEEKTIEMPFWHRAWGVANLQNSAIEVK